MSAAEGVSRFKSFVSETELDDKRKKRQEEWDKVRQPDQPLEAPEEEYDPRSLYARLQEQKDKKQAEFEKAHKLKNMIRGLDNDEVQFLDLVDKTKEEMEKQIWEEETREITEYRKAVATIEEEAHQQKLVELKKGLNPASSSQPSSTKKSQSSLLAGVVKRKSVEKSEEAPEKKPKYSDDSDKMPESSREKVHSDDNDSPENKKEETDDTDDNSENKVPISPTAKCLGILPGLGAYSDSSDSEETSGSDLDVSGCYDLLGRRITHSHDGHHHEKTKS